MTKEVEKKYWFKTKKYGWGWGIPNTRQGWLAFGVFVAVWLGAMAWLLLPHAETEPPVRNQVLFGIILLADVAGLVYVSFKYGEPPSSLSKALSFGSKSPTFGHNPLKTRRRN